jgi:predicted nucleic acid-binding protein
MLLLSSDFKSLCENATIYLDTNVFIYAFEKDELVDLLVTLKVEKGSTLATVSSVEYEFTRGSQSLQEVLEKREFLSQIVEKVISVGSLLEDRSNDVFSTAMSLVVNKKSSQYTDYLLATLLHKFSRRDTEKHYVLSGDVPAFPNDMFNIEGIVSIRLKRGDVMHLNLISLNMKKYEGILSAVNKNPKVFAVKS